MNLINGLPAGQLIIHDFGATPGVARIRIEQVLRRPLMRNDRSFIELRARERAHALLDDGSYRELLDPFDGIMSPWLGARASSRNPMTVWWSPKARSTASLRW
nr:Malonate decarboxylase subunit delta [Klebsiella pneumoniae]